MYAERFKSTHCAFQNVLGLSEEAIQRVLAVLAGVLYLGQLQLIVDDDCGSTGRGIDNGNGNGNAVDDAALTVCASLLQVDPVLLHQSLTTRLLVTSSSSGGSGSGSGSSAETVRTTLSQSQALLARDALAKEVYARLFAWIVQQVNDSTHLSNIVAVDSSQVSTPIAATSSASSPFSTPVSTPVSDGEYSPTATASPIDNREEDQTHDQLTISLLDIFGFENFTSATTTTTSSSGSGNFKGTKSKSHHSDNCNNGFEQLCINYCNEKLQHMFTNDVIVAVQQEFVREGLHIADSYASGMDTGTGINTGAGSDVTVSVPVLRLFEHNRTGLINLLNEECVVPGGCEASFLAKLLKNNSKFNNSSTSVSECSSVLQAVPFSSAQFTVHHYADSVTYTTYSFIEKNRDTLPVLAAQLLASSSFNSLLASLFVPAAAVPDNSSGNNNSNHSNNRRAPVSTMGKFRAQLDSLLHTVRATRCRYIRCLKPNSSKSSAEFDASLVLQQLRSGGVVQAVRVSRAAYPHKMTHRECLQRFCNCWGHNTTTWLLRIHRADVTDASSLNKRACVELWQCAEVIPVLAEASLAPIATVAASAQTQSLVVQVGHTMVYFAAGLLEALDRSKLTYLNRRILPIQARVRAWLQRKQYLSVLKSIVAVQAVVRRDQARAQYKMSLLSVTAVQQWYRVCLQRRRDRQIVIVAGTFARWFERVSTMRQLRALTQAVKHRRRHHRHDYQEQHQVQQQKSLDQLPAVQDLEHMGLIVNAGGLSRLPLQSTQLPSSVVTAASTQTDPCLCAHCGSNPSTYVAATEVGSSVAVLAVSSPQQLPPHLSPGPTALPILSKLVQALRALQSALLKEWERSLLQDVQESIDVPTALVLAMAAMICSALCNSNM